jgi:hypothetical protein
MQPFAFGAMPQEPNLRRWHVFHPDSKKARRTFRHGGRVGDHGIARLVQGKRLSANHPGQREIRRWQLQFRKHRLCSVEKRLAVALRSSRRRSAACQKRSQGRPIEISIALGINC